MQAERANVLMESCSSRRAKATDLLAEDGVDAERLFEIACEPDICQIATAPYHVESSGATVMRPKTGDFWACWGRPAENDYQHIPFSPFEATSTPV